ncbi:MAG: hypothetical protein FJ100_21250 [Deltaproteobacteria bacterium]|nr:hypothetical protein [Deltaproteobacteria bacterium]
MADVAAAAAHDPPSGPLDLTPIQTQAVLNARAAWPVTAASGGRGQRRLTLEIAGSVPFRATVAASGDRAHPWTVAHGVLPSDTDPATARAVLDWCRQAEATLQACSARWPDEAAPPRRESLQMAQAAALSADLGAPWLEQWPLLAQWADLATARTGSAPQWWRQTEPGPALLVTLPTLPKALRSDAHLLLRLGEGLGDGAALPGWAAALGFGADGEGVVQTLPTPASFVHLARHALGRDPAFVPLLCQNAWFVAWERPWLEAMVAGRAMINVPRPGVGRWIGPRSWRLGARALPGVRAALHALVVVPGHDLALHCMPQHRIPAADREGLCSPIRAALARCPGPAAPDALARFFENDLTRHCQAIWRDCQAAGDFDVLWRQRFADIATARDRRLDRAARLGRLGGWVPMQQWLVGAERR